MDYTKNLIRFVILITVLLFAVSIVNSYSKFKWKPIDSINILADVIKSDTVTSVLAETPVDTISNINTPVTVVDSIQGADTLQNKTNDDTLRTEVVHTVFKNFSEPNRITDFQEDPSNTALKRFISKLIELKNGQRKKIRIAYLGDSMIEGDLITQTLRKLLQQTFGGYGIGFMPMSSLYGADRNYANTSYSNWQESNFIANKNGKKLFLSGRCFEANGYAYTQIKDKTAPSTSILEKHLLFGNTLGTTTVTVNGKPITIQAANIMNDTILESSAGNTLRFEVVNANNLYGFSLESPFGIILDNFSFRGISGHEYGRMDTAFLSAIAKTHSYDLIVMQYGVNMFVKPTDSEFNWFFGPFTKSIYKLKAAFKDADVLLVSSADKAFRYDDSYKTAIGLRNLLTFQQRVAYSTGSAFYNTYASMGGEGSMVRWVNSNPPLAYKDYTHLTPKGADIIGKSIYDAILFEYNKAVQNSSN